MRRRVWQCSRSCAAVPLGRVEGIAQAVADEIEGERKDEDGGTGYEDQPGGAQEIGLALEDHHAPGRGGRLDAAAEEGQHGFEEDGGGDAERRVDGDGRDEMWQQMTDQDAQGTRT